MRLKRTLWSILSTLAEGAMLAACAGATAVPVQPGRHPMAPVYTQAPRDAPMSLLVTAPEPSVAGPGFSGTRRDHLCARARRLEPGSTRTDVVLARYTDHFFLEGVWSFDDQSQPYPELGG